MNKRELKWLRDWTVFPLLINVGIGFLVALDQPLNWPKVSTVVTLLSIQAFCSLSVYWHRRLARRWHAAGGLWAFNLGLFFFMGALEQWALMPPLWLVIGISAIPIMSIWSLRYVASLWPDLLKRDVAIGRFNLERGTFDLTAISLEFPYKSQFMRKIAPTIVVLLPVFPVLGAVIGVELTRPERLGSHELWVGACYLLVTLGMSYGLAHLFYTYRWIRRWERQTGRTMWIKGFEPKTQSPSSVSSR